MRRVSINGVEIVVGTDRDAKENFSHINVDRDAIKLGDGHLYIFTALGGDEIVELLGVREIGTFDWAKPQAWYSAEVARVGLQATEHAMWVWLYPHDRTSEYRNTGRPLSLRKLMDGWLLRVICRTLAGLTVYRDDKLNTMPDTQEQWFHLAAVGIGGIDYLRDDAMVMHIATDAEETIAKVNREASHGKA
jgi:hypothetical protein